MQLIALYGELVDVEVKVATARVIAALNSYIGLDFLIASCGIYTSHWSFHRRNASISIGRAMRRITGFGYSDVLQPSGRVVRRLT